MTHLPPNWRERLCAILGVHGWLEGKFPHEVMRFLDAMQRAEGGQATWNPLNATTHVYAGADRRGAAWQESKDYNSTGVCNYLKPSLGVMATGATFLNGNFDQLLGALQGAAESGKTAEQIVREHDVEIRRWGTSPTLMLKILKEDP